MRLFFVLAFCFVTPHLHAFNVGFFNETQTTYWMTPCLKFRLENFRLIYCFTDATTKTAPPTTTLPLPKAKGGLVSIDPTVKGECNFRAEIHFDIVNNGTDERTKATKKIAAETLNKGLTGIDICLEKVEAGTTVDETKIHYEKIYKKKFNDSDDEE